ncbi:MAG: hypothetical protein Q7Q73_01850 [Verrucomicrobiota bacterium JB024]|nr:hypothetical protein [Verrucomicrobiota bacterium JB024]
MTPDAADQLHRLGALPKSICSLEEQFSVAAHALAALPLHASIDDREILLARLDAVMMGDEGVAAEIVWYPTSIRYHFLAPLENWAERRFGPWLVAPAMTARAVERNRDDLIERLRKMQRGYVASVYPGVVGAPWDAIADHADVLGGHVLRTERDWWLPRLDAVTMLKLRWNDVCDGRLTFKECCLDRRCALSLPHIA